MMTPFDLPARAAAGQEFELQRVDFGSPTSGGRTGGVQAGFPIWLGIWTLGKMGQDTSDEWRGFDLQLRGAQRLFYGRDLGRPYPKAHITGFSRMTRTGGGTFDGSATGWSEALDADNNSRVTLHGLPSGLTLSTGDYIGFKWDAAGDVAGTHRARALVRIVRGGGAVANAAGDVTVTSEPPVPTIVPGGAIAHLDLPCCVMRKVTDQTKLGPINRSLALTSGTIVGLQDLLP